MRTHLITGGTIYGPQERREELLQCLQNNRAVFDVFTPLGDRPTFREMFAECLPDCINVIANQDIYFDDTLPTDMPEGHCYALSRYDQQPDGTLVPWHKRDSQDAWIIKGGPHVIPADFTSGVAGCDNRLAWALRKAGFIVTNPCKTIVAVHLHNSNYRTYIKGGFGPGRGGEKIERIPPPYAFVKPE